MYKQDKATTVNTMYVKQPSFKEGYGPSKEARVKSCEIQGDGQEMTVIVISHLQRLE